MAKTKTRDERKAVKFELDGKAVELELWDKYENSKPAEGYESEDQRAAKHLAIQARVVADLLPDIHDGLVRRGFKFDPESYRRYHEYSGKALDTYHKPRWTSGDVTVTLTEIDTGHYSYRPSTDGLYGNYRLAVKRSGGRPVHYGVANIDKAQAKVTEHEDAIHAEGVAQRQAGKVEAQVKKVLADAGIEYKEYESPHHLCDGRLTLKAHGVKFDIHFNDDLDVTGVQVSRRYGAGESTSSVAGVVAEFVQAAKGRELVECPECSKYYAKSLGECPDFGDEWHERHRKDS